MTTLLPYAPFPSAQSGASTTAGLIDPEEARAARKAAYEAQRAASRAGCSGSGAGEAAGAFPADYPGVLE